MKIIYIEDNKSDRSVFEGSVEQFQDMTGRVIEVEYVETVEDAIETLDNTFDGAVIDMNLSGDADAGNKVIRNIADQGYRIPITILTGTPDSVEQTLPNIRTEKKGGVKITDILQSILSSHVSGLSKVMSGRGIFDQLLTRIYYENILAQQDTWASYGETDSDKTEKALIRHTLNHLIHLVELDSESSFPEEVYIKPPLDTLIRTGSVVKKKSEDGFFVVLNPLCDLTPRSKFGGEYKAHEIILAPIHTIEELYERLPSNQKQVEMPKTIGKIAPGLQKNDKSNIHFLPPAANFEGGYINWTLFPGFHPLSDVRANQYLPSHKRR